MNILNIILSAAPNYNMFDLNISYGDSGGVPYIIISGVDILQFITSSNGLSTAISLLKVATGSVLDVITGFWLVKNLPSIIRGRPDIEAPTIMFKDPLLHNQILADTVLGFDFG